MWNKVVWYCQNLSAVAIAFISFLVMNSQIPTESAPSRSKVLLEEIRVALERTRSSFVSKGLLAVLVVLSGFYLQEASAAERAKPDPAIEKRIQELIPSLEGYIATGMKAFDVPGLAIGYEASFVHQVADFITGIASGKPAQPDFRNAYETQLVLDAVLDSGKARQWQEVAHGLYRRVESTIYRKQLEALGCHRSVRAKAADLCPAQCRQIPTAAQALPYVPSDRAHVCARSATNVDAQIESVIGAFDREDVDAMHRYGARRQLDRFAHARHAVSEAPTDLSCRESGGSLIERANQA